MMSIDDGIAPLLWAGAGLGVAAMVATSARSAVAVFAIGAVGLFSPLSHYSLIGACFSAFLLELERGDSTTSDATRFSRQVN